jgi:hypothetical protein
MPSDINNPLMDKLGIKNGMKIVILNAPPLYERLLGEIPEGIIKKVNPHGAFDFIQYFALNKQELELKFEWLKQHTKPEGMLWISWLKKSSGFATDLNENALRETGHRHGMIDDAACSIDDWWSAMKFVFLRVDNMS